MAENRTENLIALFDSAEPHEVFAAVNALKKMHGKSALEILYPENSADKIYRLERENARLQEQVDKLKVDQVKLDGYHALQKSYSKLLQENRSMQIDKERLAEFNEMAASHNKTRHNNKNLKAYLAKDRKKIKSLDSEITRMESRLKKSEQKKIHNRYGEQVERSIMDLFGKDFVESESSSKKNFVATEQLYHIYKTELCEAEVTKTMFSKCFRSVYGIKKSHRSNNIAALSGMRLKLNPKSPYSKWAYEFPSPQR